MTTTKKNTAFGRLHGLRISDGSSAIWIAVNITTASRKSDGRQDPRRPHHSPVVEKIGGDTGSGLHTHDQVKRCFRQAARITNLAWPPEYPGGSPQEVTRQESD